MSQEWFISCNPKLYDCINAFRDLHKIDWKQSANIATGDIVYIYVSGEEHAVRLKCKVNKADIVVPDIDDHKYDLSGEFDGKAGRYMELELIEELKGDLYDRSYLQKHGFDKVQGPIRVSQQLIKYFDVVHELLHSKEMNPSEHDGSYELAHETVLAYKNMNNLNDIDFKDLNLIYHMVIGTWKHGIDCKKKSVSESHLSENEKIRLIRLLDDVWNNATRNVYANREGGNASIGMFGTGFMSFRETKEEECKRFIKMCIDILDKESDEEIFDICNKALFNGITRMQAGSASVILHCLKPYTFPIFNSNMDNQNIFVYLGVTLFKPKELSYYIFNCKKVKEFRDKNFIVKNYRIFDRIAQKLGNNKDSEIANVLQYEPVEQPNNYWPSAEEYPVNLTKDDWKHFIEDVESKGYAGCMRVLACYVDIGGVGSPKTMSDRYKGHSMVYTSSMYNMSKRAINYFKMKPCPDGDCNRYFPIAFWGHVGSDINSGTYEYIMRPELLQALREMDLSGIDLIYKDGDDNMIEKIYDKNLILYGPPGTGKTYNTIIYAVAICDNRSIEELEQISYEEVLERYHTLKDTEKRIAFTTFHQSYGYEEFIEGIKPKMDSDSDNLEYSIKDGIFKAFCERALKNSTSISEVKISDSAQVWNVILGGKEDSGLKQRCLDEEVIRIGWHELPKIITEDTKGLNGNERCILLNFQDKMEIGDIVVVRETQETVDAIGVITGNAEFDTSDKFYPRKRKVKWIHKGFGINIIDLNGGIKLDRKSIYPLSRISVGDLLSRLDIHYNNGKNATKPYVFIIDEINRGNISKIFGELITLIEPAKRKGAAESMEAILPYSNVPFGVPDNIYIIGTMNTADRSIALLDTALRRRFQFEEMMPDTDVLRNLGADKIVEGNIELDVANMLSVINKRIEYLYDREHTIGHAFFTELKDEPTINKLSSIFRKSVIPLLQEYFYEDYSKIRMILGDDGKADTDNMFIIQNEIKPNKIFRGDTSDVDIPEYSYTINDKAFNNIMSYREIVG